MRRFESEREAKEFLAERIAEEARRRGEPLSEVERKMLYFSETGCTLPDIADVAGRFNEECDEQHYKQKIIVCTSRRPLPLHSDSTSAKQDGAAVVAARP